MRSARTRVAALAGTALALLLTVACSTPTRIASPSASSSPSGSGSPSATGPRSDATLEGRVVDLDGHPLPGVPISVAKTSTGFQVGRVLEAVVTFGLSCVASPDDCPGREQVVDSAVTDAAGRYSLTLPSAYLPGYETDADWVASVGRAPKAGEVTGPSSSYELEVDTATQAAPDLPLWDVAPEVASSAGQVTVSVGGSGTLKAQVGSGAVQLTTAAGQNVWQATGPVDARVLEDGPLRVVVTGHTDSTVRHSEGRTIYHERLQTASVAYQGSSVPPSRGKACTLDQTPAVGCLLTDGDLVAGTAHQVGAIGTVDLGAVGPVGLVVVRGNEPVDALTLEVSSDGTTWSALRTGPLGGALGVVATPGVGTKARYLRLRSSAPGELREVSVWPPLAHPLAGGPSAGSGPDAGSNLLVRMVALVLVLMVGWALVIIRRRRPRRAG